MWRRPTSIFRFDRGIPERRSRQLTLDNEHYWFKQDVSADIIEVSEKRPDQSLQHLQLMLAKTEEMAQQTQKQLAQIKEQKQPETEQRKREARLKALISRADQVLTENIR